MKNSGAYRSLCFTVLAITSVLMARAQSVNTSFDAMEKVKSYLDTQAASGTFRGSVLVGTDGKIVFEKGFGFADQEWGVLNSPKTKFRIASLTKQFTAACILLLQERGQLEVHDPISKYIPDLPVAWRTITLHQLLTHTSGIPNYTDLPRVEKVLNRTGLRPEN